MDPYCGYTHRLTQQGSSKVSWGSLIRGGAVSGFFHSHPLARSSSTSAYSPSPLLLQGARPPPVGNAL